MAAGVRQSRALRGLPLRVGALLFAGVATAVWVMLPHVPATLPAVPIPDGKYEDRLALVGGDSEFSVREARIVDTLAMFGLPQAEPQPWSAVLVPATVAEAAIRPIPPFPRSAAADATRSNAARLASRGTARPAPDTRPSLAFAKEETASERSGIDLFGWEVPGSRHVPTRQDAQRAVEQVGTKASSVGRETGKVAARAAAAVGDGLAGAGGALASSFGWR